MTKLRGEGAVVEFVALRTVQVCLPVMAGLAVVGQYLEEPQYRPISRLAGAAVTLGLGAYFLAVFDHRTTWSYPLTTHLPTDSGNAVALTFDDGPHPETTPTLLEILAHYDARATFFLVAEQAQRFPHLAREIVEAGHTVGCHGLRHRAMVGKAPKTVAQELTKATKILEDTTGRPMRRLFRPPHGFKTPALCRTITQLGWEIVSWSLDSGDYDPISHEALAATALAAQPGEILLFHERPDRQTTQAALPKILEGLQQRGLSCIHL